MAKVKLTQKDFDKMFDHVKEVVLADKLNKAKEKDVITFIDESLKDNTTRFFYMLFRKLAKIDRKIEISIEVAEMCAFATTYCIAKKFNFTEKEMNLLYDEIDHETKLMIEKTISAKEEMKDIAAMLALKYKTNNNK
jgi:hypothetical protein